MARKKSQEAERKKQLAYEMYMQGKEMQEIMAATGYKESSIRAFLHRKGIRRRVFLEEYKAECIAMYKAGKGYREIADRFSVTAKTVQTNLIQWGYVQRGLSIAGCMREPEPEPGGLVYADNRKKIGIVTVRGKRYQDVTSYFI